MIKARLRRLAGHQDGATAIEYALIAFMLSIAIIGSVVVLGDENTSIFESAFGALSGAIGSGLENV